MSKEMKALEIIARNEKSNGNKIYVITLLKMNLLQSNKP